jgi:hypothetical protein
VDGSAEHAPQCAVAERSVEQAKLAFNNYTQAAEEAVSTFEQWVDANQASAQNIRKKAMRFAERNVYSAFELAQGLPLADPETRRAASCAAYSTDHGSYSRRGTFSYSVADRTDL